MPKTTPAQKIRKTKKFGGIYICIELVGDTFDEAYAAACLYSEQQGSVFIPPFDHPTVIAGQGTVGCEIIDQL